MMRHGLGHEGAAQPGQPGRAARADTANGMTATLRRSAGMVRTRERTRRPVQAR